MVDNADWLCNLNYIEFLRDIGRHFSVNRMLSFEAYKMRLETGLSFIEFNYQLLQSYDYLVLYRKYGCKLQIGGDDQWGNIVSGMELVRRIESANVYALTHPLVTRCDGKKMGKTEKGTLFLDAGLTKVYDFYQYWINIPDQDVEKFLLLYTFLPVNEVKKRLPDWKLEQIPWCKEGFWISGERRDVGNLPEHILGYIYVQESASIFPWRERGGFSPSPKADSGCWRSHRRPNHAYV